MTVQIKSSSKYCASFRGTEPDISLLEPGNQASLFIVHLNDHTRTTRSSCRPTSAGGQHNALRSGTPLDDQKTTSYTYVCCPQTRFNADSPIFEEPGDLGPAEIPVLLAINTQTGEMTPWNLRARLIPLPHQIPTRFSGVRTASSGLEKWKSFVNGNAISLEPGLHTVVLWVEAHTTAFLRCRYQPSHGSTMSIKYAECYERPPKVYPWLRDKGDRLADGQLLGPCDLVDLSTGPEYEPFWFRTFRFIELEVAVGAEGLTVHSIELRQTNYPLQPRATWDSSSSEMGRIWDVSLRTLRNCMFDGYSDCPFYEQLQ